MAMKWENDQNMRGKPSENQIFDVHYRMRSWEMIGVLLVFHPCSDVEIMLAILPESCLEKRPHSIARNITIFRVVLGPFFSEKKCIL